MYDKEISLFFFNQTAQAFYTPVNTKNYFWKYEKFTIILICKKASEQIKFLKAFHNFKITQFKFLKLASSDMILKSGKSTGQFIFTYNYKK